MQFAIKIYSESSLNTQILHTSISRSGVASWGHHWYDYLCRQYVFIIWMNVLTHSGPRSTQTTCNYTSCSIRINIYDYYRGAVYQKLRHRLHGYRFFSPLLTAAHCRTGSLNWIVNEPLAHFSVEIALVWGVFTFLRLNIAVSTMYLELCAISALTVQKMRLGKAWWRAVIAGRWPNREEASRCDSTIRSRCMAIFQPSGCQLSTMEATNTHFISGAFCARWRSHHHTLAASYGCSLTTLQ